MYWTIDRDNNCIIKVVLKIRPLNTFTCVHEAAPACRCSCRQPQESWSKKGMVSIIICSIRAKGAENNRKINK